MIRRLVVLILVLLTMAAPIWAAKVGAVWVLTIEGQIDPATADYVGDGIRDAQRAGAQAVLIVMNTPGGSVSSMQNIVESFFASKVPVIVYVAPDGATAGSAGTMITLAANVAAMAPVTNIGSASPVSGAPGEEGKEISPTMKKKVTNFLVEYAKSIAEQRGRNIEWAGKAVSEAANLKATDALKNKVIDIIAKDRWDLFRQLQGRQVKVAGDKTVTLSPVGAPVEERPMGVWDGFLHVLSDPYVVLVLTLMAMYGIIYELANPGSIFPGVIGAISVLLLLYSYSVIPVNAAGFAFIALALALFAIDLFAPTHGVLTTGGIVSMFIGLMMLFRSSEGFMVSITTIAAVAIATGAFFFFLIGLGVRSLKKPYIAGREGVVGHTGEVRMALEPTGRIFVDGSLWTATSEEGNIPVGEKVIVTKMDGLHLKVRK